MKFRNRERLFPVLPIIIIPTDRPQIFLTCDSKHTYIFFCLMTRFKFCRNVNYHKHRASEKVIFTCIARSQFRSMNNFFHLSETRKGLCNTVHLLSSVVTDLNNFKKIHTQKLLYKWVFFSGIQMHHFNNFKNGSDHIIVKYSLYCYAIDLVQLFKKIKIFKQ